MTECCSLSWCCDPVVASGLCSAHYHRRRKGNDLIRPVRKRGGGVRLYRGDSRCSVFGCRDHPVALGLCSGHYSQHRRLVFRDRVRDNERKQNRVKRARRASAPGYHSRHQLRQRFVFYGGLCVCGVELDWNEDPRTWHWDHRIPLSKGGSEWPANYRPLCASCNLKKHARSELEIKKGTSE